MSYARDWQQNNVRPVRAVNCPYVARSTTAPPVEELGHTRQPVHAWGVQGEGELLAGASAHPPQHETGTLASSQVGRGQISGTPQRGESLAEGLAGQPLITMPDTWAGVDTIIYHVLFTTHRL